MRLFIRITLYSLTLGSLFVSAVLLCDSNNRTRIKNAVSQGRRYYSARETELVELLSSTDEEIEQAQSRRERKPKNKHIMTATDQF